MAIKDTIKEGLCEDDVELCKKLAKICFVKRVTSDGRIVKAVEPWGIYFYPPLFKEVVNGMKKLIEPEVDNIYYFCGVPLCGLSLAGILSFEMNKPSIEPVRHDLINVLGEYFHSQKLIERGKNILLIDATINTGTSAYRVYNTLKNIDGKFICFASIIFNDMFPDQPESQADQGYLFKKHIIENNQAKYLFRASKLYEFL